MPCPSDFQGNLLYAFLNYLFENRNNSLVKLHSAHLALPLITLFFLAGSPLEIHKQSPTSLKILEAWHFVQKNSVYYKPTTDNYMCINTHNLVRHFPNYICAKTHEYWVPCRYFKWALEAEEPFFGYSALHKNVCRTVLKTVLFQNLLHSSYSMIWICLEKENTSKWKCFNVPENKGGLFVSLFVF